MGHPCSIRKSLPAVGAALLIFAVLMTTAGCNEGGTERARPVTEEPPERGVLVSAAEYGDRWPLTVSEARVELIGSSVAVLHAEGRTYALNGTAQSRGYPRIDPIWRNNPDIPGTKISISPLIQLALSLGED